MSKSEDQNQNISEPQQRVDMETSVLTQVHFVGNRINSTGSSGYRKWFGIGISEFRLLVVIGNEPGSTGARINEIMGLDLGAISRTLRRMESNGHVVSLPHPRHPSYRCWHLTKQGAELHDRVSKMTELREAAILDGFTKAEVFQLLSFLHRLSDNTEKLEKLAIEGSQALDEA